MSPNLQRRAVQDSSFASASSDCDCDSRSVAVPYALSLSRGASLSTPECPSTPGTPPPPGLRRRSVLARLRSQPMPLIPCPDGTGSGAMLPKVAQGYEPQQPTSESAPRPSMPRTPPGPRSEPVARNDVAPVAATQGGGVSGRRMSDALRSQRRSARAEAPELGATPSTSATSARTSAAASKQKQKSSCAHKAKRSLQQGRAAVRTLWRKTCCKVLAAPGEAAATGSSMTHSGPAGGKARGRYRRHGLIRATADV